LDSPSDPPSIFENGKLRPGIYKIQNLHSQTYLDIHEHSRETCCRPAQNLEEGRGLWKIMPLEAGYSIQRVEPGKPKQFCTPMEGLSNGTPLYVAEYPVAWRVEVVNDDKHRGFEYVRIFWGTTKRAWDLNGGHLSNGAKVQSWEDSMPMAYRIWKLIPVKVEGAFIPSQSSSEAPGSDSLPRYDEDTTGQSSTHTRHVESEQDEFGTIVNEVTVVTTNSTSTVTTRKRYRVEDA